MGLFGRTLAMFLDFNLKLVFVLYFCINAIESKEDIFDPIDRLIQGESPPTISQIVGFSTFLFQIALRLLIAFLDLTYNSKHIFCLMITYT